MLTRGGAGMLARFLAAVVGLAALLLGLFAAWGRATERRPDPGAVRLVFTGWGGIIERQVFGGLVEEFERRHPGIDVEYRQSPRDYLTKLKLMFAGRTPPDVFYIPDGDFPSFARSGQLRSLEPFLGKSAVIRPAEFWESGLARYRYDGRVFGRGALHALPKDIGPTTMYVNLELLRSAGGRWPLAEGDATGQEPLDWNQAVALWRKLTRDLDGDGRTDQWGTHGLNLEAAVWSHGGAILSPDGRRFVMHQDERALQAAEWLVGLQTVERVAPAKRQQESIPVDTLFLTGRLGTFIGGRWMVPQFRNAEFRWDVAPLPVSPVTRRQAGWSGSVGLAVSPQCRHPEAAWKLVEFLAGPEGQAAQAQTGFQIPNQRWLSRTDVFLQPARPPEHAEVFLRAAAHQRAGPPTHTPNDEWWQLMLRKLDAAYRGELSAREAIRRSAAEVQEKLDAAWGEDG